MRMPFGKHRGKDLADIPDDYLVWVLDNCETISPTLRRAIEARLDIEAEYIHPPPPPPRFPLARAREDILAAVDRCRRRLAGVAHPDRGGDVRVMQAANDAMDELRRTVESAIPAG